MRKRARQQDEREEATKNQVLGSKKKQKQKKQEDSNYSYTKAAGGFKRGEGGSTGPQLLEGCCWERGV